MKFPAGIKKILNSKVLLYLVYFITAMNVFGYVNLNDFNSIALFTLVSYITSFFNKNHAVILLTGILITNILGNTQYMIVEGLTSRKKKEGMEHGDDEEEEEEEEETVEEMGTLRESTEAEDEEDEEDEDSSSSEDEEELSLDTSSESDMEDSEKEDLFENLEKEEDNYFKTPSDNVSQVLRIIKQEKTQPDLDLSEISFDSLDSLDFQEKETTHGGWGFTFY